MPFKIIVAVFLITDDMKHINTLCEQTQNLSMLKCVFYFSVIYK